MDSQHTFSEKLKEFLNYQADQLSISTGFIKRKRNLKGSSFAKAMIMGHLGQESSLERMCHLLSQDEVKISKQGLDLRFTESSVKFMKALYEKSLTLMERSFQMNCEVLKLFKGVKLLDSTYISLPPALKEQYRGYGSRFQNRGPATGAALKIQLLYDYLHQSIRRLELKEGVRSDQGYRDYLEDISAGDLLISDLGYFVPASFKCIEEKQAYFLSRYKTDTHIYDPHTHKKIDLVEALKKKTFMTQEVLLGSQVKMKVRIVCQKVSLDQSAYRRRKANHHAKYCNYTSSSQSQYLLDWSIFITNIPVAYVQAKDLLILYKLRWQIELLFKLYKSYGRIDKFSSQKPYRILCQLYAKLIGIIIFHSMTNCFDNRENRQLSLMKAFAHLKFRSQELFLALCQKARDLKFFVEDIIAVWSGLCLKEKHRRSTLAKLNLLSVHA